MDCMQKKLSVLMFPWLGHGHISPFLELGKKLADRGFTVYLCSTPVNLDTIEKRVGFDDSSIKLVELHLSSQNLPPHYHTTNGLPSDLMGTLKEAFGKSESTFVNVLKTLKPDLLIYDFLQPWAQEAAYKLDIPAVLFITSSITMTTVLFHAYKRPDVDFPYKNIYYRDYDTKAISDLKKSVEDHKRDKSNLVIDCIERSRKVVLIKGFDEIDGKYVKYLSLLCGKKVVPVGPLVQEPVNNVDDENSETLQWLDNKEKASTVFVSFGSEYFLSDDDFKAIAEGLLQSNVNFIWVVRFPVGETISLENKLRPLGFYEMVGDRGMVVEGWVPQAKILGHSSIGGFVSHCGWNSVIESMKFGVPIIALPMHIDQPINARLVEDVGAGIEVLRDHGMKLQGESVASVIRQVVVMEDGKYVRMKVKELSLKIKMKNEEEIDEVVYELQSLCGQVNELQNLRGQRKHAGPTRGCMDMVKYIGLGWFAKFGKHLMKLHE